MRQLLANHTPGEGEQTTKGGRHQPGACEGEDSANDKDREGHPPPGRTQQASEFPSVTAFHFLVREIHLRPVV